MLLSDGMGSGKRPVSNLQFYERERVEADGRSREPAATHSQTECGRLEKSRYGIARSGKPSIEAHPHLSHAAITGAGRPTRSKLEARHQPAANIRSASTCKRRFAPALRPSQSPKAQALFFLRPAKTHLSAHFQSMHSRMNEA